MVDGRRGRRLFLWGAASQRVRSEEEEEKVGLGYADELLLRKKKKKRALGFFGEVASCFWDAYSATGRKENDIDGTFKALEDGCSVVYVFDRRSETMSDGRWDKRRDETKEPKGQAVSLAVYFSS